MKTAPSALRRAKRRLCPAKKTKATKSLHSAMAGLFVATAMAPLTALTPKPAKPAKRGASMATRAGHSLGTVLAHLRDAQALLPGGGLARPQPGALPCLPKGARWLQRKQRTAAGAREYALYFPARPVTGLILMLHGCNQTPEDFALGTRMNALGERHGLVIAWPGQSLRRNPQGRWNWFQPGDQMRGAGEPAILAALTRRLMREFGLSREAVFVAGLSAGGAMAATLATVYPELYAGAGIHSGMGHGSARNVLTAMTAMRSGAASDPTGTPKGHPSAGTSADQSGPRGDKRDAPVRWIVFQGGADSKVHPSNAAQIVEAVVGTDAVPTQTHARHVKGRDYVRANYAGPGGINRVESWLIGAAGRAWSGGRAAGPYTDALGPDASAQMVRFFLARLTRP